MARFPTELALLLTLAASACGKPTSDSIQVWKTTEKGPGRLHDAVADHSVPPRLRAEAAAALVDIGHADEVDALLPQLSADDRAEITKSLAPMYEVAMKDPSPEKALANRDALFSLRQYSLPSDQKQIDAALLPAIEADLRAGKLRQGRHSIDKMLTAIGPDAGAMLARVLAEPGASYPVAAELLGKVGDESARDAGAAALVAHAQQHELIKGAQRGGREAYYRAIGLVGGPNALKFLEEQSTGLDRDKALMAARALELRRDPNVLPFALKVAGDPRADKAVRDEMFGVVENVGGLEAEKGLTDIISSDKDEIVRYRAFEAVLNARKVDGIVPALEAFPVAAAYKKVDVDDLLVKLIEKLGPPARPALVKALDSRSPLTRMTAVMTLEQIGRAPDAPALEKISNDTTSIKGFPSGETIGKAAGRVAEVVKKKA
jgi:hypothetical protein